MGGSSFYYLRFNNLACGSLAFYRYVPGNVSLAGTGKGYITVLYNLGLMLVLGGSLGFLMEKITDLLGYEIGEIEHFDDEKEPEWS